MEKVDIPRSKDIQEKYTVELEFQIEQQFLRVTLFIKIDIEANQLTTCAILVSMDGMYCFFSGQKISRPSQICSRNWTISYGKLM